MPRFAGEGASRRVRRVQIFVKLGRVADQRVIGLDLRGFLHVDDLDRAVWLLAERQHGVVARRQLLELGFNRHAITRGVEAHRLHPVYRGVYAVGHRLLSIKGRSMAACLAAGQSGILCRRSAGYLLGQLPTGPPKIPQVTVPGSRRSPRGIRRYGDAIGPAEVTTREGIPLTAPARTLLDLASELGPEALNNAVARSIHLRLTTSAQLERLLDARPRRPGTAALRTILGANTATRGAPNSPLEELGDRFLRAHDFPPYELNVPLNLADARYVIDCLWRDQRVALEFDSRTYHGDWGSAEADRARDRQLLAHGYRPVRLTRPDLTTKSEATAAELWAILTTTPMPQPRSTEPVE